MGSKMHSNAFFLLLLLLLVLHVQVRDDAADGPLPDEDHPLGVRGKQPHRQSGLAL